MKENYLLYMINAFPMKIFCCILLTCLSTQFCLSQCVVTDVMRADGMLLRVIDPDTVYANDTISISVGLYAIEKRIYAIVLVKSTSDLKKYKEDISIVFADSTVKLLKHYITNRNSDKSIEAHFMINDDAMGYLSQFNVTGLKYTINNQLRSIPFFKNQDLLKKQLACLRGDDQVLK